MFIAPTANQCEHKRKQRNVSTAKKRSLTDFGQRMLNSSILTIEMDHDECF